MWMLWKAFTAAPGSAPGLAAGLGGDCIGCPCCPAAFWYFWAGPWSASLVPVVLQLLLCESVTGCWRASCSGALRTRGRHAHACGDLSALARADLRPAHLNLPGKTVSTRSLMRCSRARADSGASFALMLLNQ